MKSEMKRWTDEENFLGSEHVSSQIWYYLKLVRWRVRWRDEKKIFWSEHISSQISCYLKLVRWRVRWTDEQIKNFFFFGPNMYQAKSGVIWIYWDEEMKSEMKRWTDEEKSLVGSKHVSSQDLVLSEISEINSWPDDENFFGSWTCIKPEAAVIWN